MDGASKLWVWKLVILRALMYSLLTLITAFTTGVANCDFPSLTWWNKFLIIIGVIGSWLLTMIAFLDKSIAAVKEEISQDTNQQPKGQ